MIVQDDQIVQKLWLLFSCAVQSEYFGRANANISNLDILRVSLSKASLMLFYFPLVFLLCFITFLRPAMFFFLIHGQSLKLILGNLLCKSLDFSRYSTSNPSEIVLACWFFFSCSLVWDFFVCFWGFLKFIYFFWGGCLFFYYCRAAFDEFSCL